MLHTLRRNPHIFLTVDLVSNDVDRVFHSGRSTNKKTPGVARSWERGSGDARGENRVVSAASPLRRESLKTYELHARSAVLFHAKGGSEEATRTERPGSAGRPCNTGTAWRTLSGSAGPARSWGPA
ncbi:hypothetical protein FGG70_gp37 [Salinibacter phage M1EM-1]|uniref:Uncharacterized protein n=1 Tax=Salinibacter phage M1EM-1 TaxID=2681616 RepID=A0A2I6UG19_9CAUD|nr:hypothetical protein FGG70_gp37 [Salinibacter phage M1EM-1]AUO78933.1 hypothetical protein [Salinibacter phage M1EM-1]